MVKLTRAKTVSVKKSKSPKIKGKSTSSVPEPAVKEEKKPLLKKQNKVVPLKSFIQIKKEILPPKNHKVTIVDKTSKLKKEVKKEVNHAVPSDPEPFSTGRSRRPPAKEESQVLDTPFIRPKILPVIPSSFRFPLLPEKHIAMVSKVAGIFLVVSGVFLSFFNLYAESDTYARFPFFESLANLIGSQSAQTIAKTSLTVTTPTVVDPSTSNPEPRIAIDSIQPFKGTVPISVVVPYASEVTLILQSKLETHLQILGKAERFDDSTWKLNWDTSDLSDGDYLLKTIVKNQKGTYEGATDTVYSISNHGNHDTSASSTVEVNANESGLLASSTSTPESGTTTSHTTDEALTNVVIEKSDELSSNASIVLKVSVLDATEVKVYARNNNTSALFYIGLARQKTPETWYVEWKTENLPSGLYEVEAKAKIGEQVTPSRKVTIDVLGPTNNSETTATGSSTTRVNEAELKPEISLSFSKETPLSGSVVMKIKSSQLSWVELYAQPKTSLTPFFLGIASQQSPDEWIFSWETKQSPNGEYEVYARGKTVYGFVEGAHQKINIANGIATEFSLSEEKKLDSYIDAKNALTRKVEDADFLTDSSSSTVLEPEDQAYVQPIASFIKEMSLDDEVSPEVETLLQKFRTSLQEKLEALSRSERAGNQDEVQNTLNAIESLKQDTVAGIPKSIDDKDVTLRIEGYVYQIISVLQELTINNERILKERIGDSVTLDSDKDEISDYDEINLYKTNPFVADTDGDSFIDGLEVKNGFDPHNSVAEALVTHESPRDNGVLREDLLVVDSVTALRTEGDADTTHKTAKALISGKGLPNSFVTIYVFSTPVVSTVRTDAQGTWSYIFDKEIEEGTHDVYVGITDNQGRIVAKSKPLSFVKEAEAFSNVQAEPTVVPVTSTETFNATESIILLLGSVLVVMLGLILIILGIQIAKRRKVEVLATVS